MNYIDFDIVDEFRLFTLIKYSGETGKYDLYMPHREYTALLQNAGAIGIGGRDKNDRPMFQFGGIRFYSISEEEANKYRVLK
jgi:hypothetical protein